MALSVKYQYVLDNQHKPAQTVAVELGLRNRQVAEIRYRLKKLGHVIQDQSGHDRKPLIPHDQSLGKLEAYPDDDKPVTRCSCGLMLPCSFCLADVRLGQVTGRLETATTEGHGGSNALKRSAMTW
jgi:hypothetical protein